MKADERREKLIEMLAKRNDPVSASALAEVFAVSRQIIVGDIALLRAGGAEIAATPRGYVFTGERTSELEIVKRIACSHNVVQTEAELQIIVDNGCRVLDVIVEHPVYGELTGNLMLASRYDVREFMKKIEAEGAHALSELTDGIHLHTLSCPSEEAYGRVISELASLGILVRDTTETAAE